MKVVRCRAGRVLPVDPFNRLLLLRGGDPSRPDAGEWWFTIGGGCEPGESTAAAARREAFEEAGIALPQDAAPVVAQRDARFVFEGIMYEQSEDYFLVRVKSDVVTTTGWTHDERRVLSAHRWWSVPELAMSAERIYPDDLSGLLASLL